MSVHRNHNYRIGTDTLPTGKVQAKARGRRTSVKTFPVGTAHDLAAETLAKSIEGERFDHVTQLSANSDGSRRDYAIYVTNGL
jgi:hypothetical protein